MTDAQSRTASAGTASVTVYGTDDVFGEGGDAGESIATAMPVAVVNGGVVRAIRGGLANGVENDLYVIRVCDPAAFSATTFGFETAADFSAAAAGIPAGGFDLAVSSAMAAAVISTADVAH